MNCRSLIFRVSAYKPLTKMFKLNCCLTSTTATAPENLPANDVQAPIKI